MKNLLFLGFTLLCLFACISCRKTATPDAVALRSAEYFKKGDIEAFVNTFTEMPEEERAESVAIFKEKAKALLEEKGEITKCEVVESKVDEEKKRATVEVQFDYEKGEPIELTFDLFQEKGRWKIATLK